jgi:hypothetical protein
MTELNQGETRELIKVMKELVPLLARVAGTESAPQPAAGTSTATIAINAGGTALWVAVTCCAVMLAALVPMALGLYWVAMDSRDRGHQMNALYQSTPGLRELVERQMKLIEQTRNQEPEESK